MDFGLDLDGNNFPDHMQAMGLDINHNGIPDANDAFLDMDHNGIPDQGFYTYFQNLALVNPFA
jgi:hypothetical protein